MSPNINENLEQQAQALFKAWFVDFEPFGGVMPDDWRMGTLSEICGYSKDKIDIDNLTLDSYYSTENMQPNRQGAVQATTLPTIKQTTACKKGDVLISNIRPYFKKILYCFSDCGCSTDILCFVPNKTDYSAFLYCALYADKFFDYMVAGSKGTKMPRGDKQQIMVYPICIPSAEYIEKFNQAVASMLETVYTDYQGNRADADFVNLEIYLKRVWFSNGIHHHYASDKFVPAFTPEFFRTALKNVDAAKLPLADGETVDTLCDRIFPVIFLHGNTLWCRDSTSDK